MSKPKGTITPTENSEMASFREKMEGMKLPATAPKTVWEPADGHDDPLARTLQGHLVPTRINLDAPAFLPKYHTEEAANADLVANLKGESIVVPPKSQVEVDCGFSLQVPFGWKVEIAARSGWAKKNLVVTNAPGQLDSDFRGNLVVLLYNLGDEPIVIEDKARIAQMWPSPRYKFQFITDEPLDPSKRGKGGFGSTGE